MNEWFWNFSLSRRKWRGAWPRHPSRDLNPDACPTTSRRVSFHFGFLSPQESLWLNLPWPPTKVFKIPFQRGKLYVGHIVPCQKSGSFLAVWNSVTEKFPFKRRRKKGPGHQIVLINAGKFLRTERQAWLSSSQLGSLCGVLFIPRDVGWARWKPGRIVKCYWQSQSESKMAFFFLHVYFLNEKVWLFRVAATEWRAPAGQLCWVTSELIRFPVCRLLWDWCLI